MADITAYLDLVTSEHRDRARFIASLSAVLQPVADTAATIAAMPAAFDLDGAMGDQLDVVGQWVGRTRDLQIPLTGVYFSFDDASVGFDSGTWLGPFDPATGLVSLPDDSYRTLLRATIAANQWDGSIPQAYAIWEVLFGDSHILIQDGGDMSMLFALIGPEPDAVTLALLTGGYLALKPAGVRIGGYLTPSVADTPLFGFDATTSAVAGFDAGAWPTELTSS